METELVTSVGATRRWVTDFKATLRHIDVAWREGEKAMVVDRWACLATE